MRRPHRSFVALLSGFAVSAGGAACGDDGGADGLFAVSYRDAITTNGADLWPRDLPAAPMDTGSPDTRRPDASAPDTSSPADSVAPDTTPDTGPSPECTSDAECELRHSGDALGACQRWSCSGSGDCQVAALPEAASCQTAGEPGRCHAGLCQRQCGDGLLQPSLGEDCDDGNPNSGDGCRADCVLEEPIGAGFSGGQCLDDLDCAPAGSQCVVGVGGGSCAVPCDNLCADQPGSPVTFCIPADVYASRMDVSLPVDLYPALCVSKCDFARFPSTGCRAGLHCELRTRHQSLTRDEVCVPGPWSIGLALSDDGGQVLGLQGDEPEPAEPWSRLLESSCTFLFEPVEARLFRGLATTLMAMDADGRDRDWEQLCEAPADLPDVYGTHAQAEAGRAYRLPGSRLEVVDWSAAAIYGSKSASGDLVGGPLYGSRVMVYRSGASYLYADADADRPHHDPDRGRHFAMINGQQWGPLDAEIQPNLEFVTIKANSGGRFYRQWGRRQTVDFLADMALHYLATHGIPVGIGDLSLPTGGDITDHGSHETGLDADLYLLTFDGAAPPELWVSQCDDSGGWQCWYVDNDSGVIEDTGDPDHIWAASLLETLAQYAYDHHGPTHFVQNDVTVLGAFDALPGSSPRFIDASNAASAGWPPHRNHIHIRFAW